MDRASRIRRLKFRAWHRGTREADYMIGGFFDRYHGEWDEADLVWFEALLEEDDVDVMAGRSGRRPYQGARRRADDGHATAGLRRHRLKRVADPAVGLSEAPPAIPARKRRTGPPRVPARQDFRCPISRRILSARTPLTLASVPRGAQPLVMADLARAASHAERAAARCSSRPTKRRCAALPTPRAISRPSCGDRVSRVGLPALRPRRAPRCRSARGGCRRCTGCRRVRAVRSCSSPRSTPCSSACSPRSASASRCATQAGHGDRARGLIALLQRQGYGRTDTVIDAGEFAVRGSIFDIFPSGLDAGPAARFLRRRAGIPAAVRSEHPADHRHARAGTCCCPRARRCSTTTRSSASAPATASSSAPMPRRTRSTRRSATAAGSRAWSTGCRCSRTGWRRCSTTCRKATWW